MFQELKDFFTVTLIKRLSSPLMSTFLFSLVITNYDIFLVAFSSSASEEKISFISTQVDLVFGNQWHRIVVPLLLTLFYVFIWPKIDRWAYRYSKIESFKYKELLKEIEDEAPMTRDEEKEFKLRWREQFKDFESQIADRDRVIEGHKNTFLEFQEQSKIESDNIIQNNLNAYKENEEKLKTEFEAKIIEINHLEDERKKDRASLSSAVKSINILKHEKDDLIDIYAPYKALHEARSTIESYAKTNPTLLNLGGNKDIKNALAIIETHIETLKQKYNLNQLSISSAYSGIKFSNTNRSVSSPGIPASEIPSLGIPASEIHSFRIPDQDED